jgi:hypothetical protein
MNRSRRDAFVAGLVLIALGAVLLIAQWIGWDRIWPIFPLLGGLAFLAAYVVGGFREAGFVFVGLAATLVGLFFFGFSLGYWEWAEMSRLWPVFLIIGGVAFIALFVAEGTGDAGTLGVGCAAVIVGIAGLLIAAGVVGSDIIRLWPLLVILVGIIALAGAVWQAVRRE